MSTYSLISQLLSYFAYHLGLPAYESRQFIQEDICANPIDFAKFKKEVHTTLADPTFDWLDAEQRADFIFLTPKHNKQAAKVDFINHVLDLFYPEVNLPEEELAELKTEVMELLKLHLQTKANWVAVDELALQVSSKQYDIPGAIIFQVMRMWNQLGKDEMALKLDPEKGYCLALKSSTEEEVLG